ncbi:MAG: phosphocholine cytidylyltransferase family protein [Desulfobacterales bacterium]|nr:phosphocholine cytidylyltransferase family protein [Desulfobacterales bacterium]
MKAIVLSAGQGKRLLPLTSELPKCLLPIGGKTLIEWQIDELNKCGITQITVVTGYRSEKVKAVLDRRYEPGQVKTLYNEAYAKTDNLVSCWAAREEMTEDFLLLNGDTLFEKGVIAHLFASPPLPVTVVVSCKERYDADDMKVEMADGRLVKIGKDLAPENVHGESIGMILFRGQGPGLFRYALEKALDNPTALHQWYLSVIGEMAREMPVSTCLINGLKWCEIDYPSDLKQADSVVGACDGSIEVAQSFNIG